MSRTADYTIQGFLYQFHKTLLEILRSDDEDTITVEGPIEDVEVSSPSRTKAIQCKYHEAQDTFTISKIYKPLLQMMDHYVNNPESNIEYRLYAYFPKINGDSPPKVEIGDLERALETSDKNLKKYVANVAGKINLNLFYEKFGMEFGKSLDDLEVEIVKAFEINQIQKEDIHPLFFPNAIHRIAKISSMHDVDQRKITKLKLLQELNAVRKTIISRWTLALKSHEKILKARKRQLKPNLDKNVRLRYFIIKSEQFDDYSSEIVMFISDYLDKFHFKPAHTETPVFFLDTNQDDFDEIQSRLYKKGITPADGKIGAKVEEAHLFRNPRRTGTRNNVQRDFLIRMALFKENGYLISGHKCDDLFLIGDIDISNLDTMDINVEILNTESFKEVKFLLGVTDVLN